VTDRPGDELSQISNRPGEDLRAVKGTGLSIFPAGVYFSLA
jgi:hypothetical protein